MSVNTKIKSVGFVLFLLLCLPFVQSISAQVVEIATSRIGNMVWLDADGDGRRDRGEVGIEDVPITLSSCEGDEIASTTTNANGKYQFKNLPAGNYQLSVEFEYTLDEPMFSSPTDASTVKRDSNGIPSMIECVGPPIGIDENGGTIELGPGSCELTVITSCIELGVEEKNNTIDFGFAPTE